MQHLLILGDLTSHVQAYWEDENIVAQIETQEETFVVEVKK